jgi:hypothetical protein
MMHPTLLWSRPYHHGLRHLHEGDLAAAERELTEAVRVAERLPAPDDRLGCSLAALAELCRVQRRRAEAERLYRRALSVEEQALGPAHPYTRAVAEGYTELLRQLAPAATRCTVPRRRGRTAGRRRDHGPGPVRTTPIAERCRVVAGGARRPATPDDRQSRA